MEGHIKYLVQAQCQPSPAGREEEIVRSLGRNFDVKECTCDSTGLTLELRSNHHLADGAFKDLADLLIEALDDHNLRLRTGVINRVERNSLSTAVGDISRELSVKEPEESLAGACRLAGGSLKKLAWGVLGKTRLVPVMYFHRDTLLDLMLASKARSLAMSPVPGQN